MAAKESKFRLWWNHPNVQRVVGAVFSIGAAVVILGALFKIMHWPGAGIMLTVGMGVEAIIFVLGVFDKPHKEFDWDKVFDFDDEAAAKKQVLSSASSTATISAPSSAAALSSSVEGLAAIEVKTLNDSIKKIAETAEQFSALTDIVKTTKSFMNNLQLLSETTADFNSTQKELTAVSQKLQLSYDELNKGVVSAEKSTEAHVRTADSIAKLMLALNSTYEIQLKELQSQTKAVAKQAENSQQIADSLSETLEQSKKLHHSTKTASKELDKYKDSTVLLSEQIGDLNKVYGNMLNSLS